MTHFKVATPSLALLLMLAAGKAGAQVDDLQRRTQDYLAMVDAETGKSPICRAYEGKMVAVAAFDAAADKLKEPAPKGEYETADQYRARSGAQRPLTGLIVLSVPINRTYLRYDADVGALTVLAGAFKQGEFSEAAQATGAAEIAVLSAENRLGTGPRFTIGLPGSERTVSSGSARNAFGATIQTAEVDRLTRGISLAGARLFAFAPDADSTLTSLDVGVARAPAFTAGLRAAIVVEPQAPFVVSNRMRGAAPTNLKPVRYTELSSILLARPVCALLLNGQSRVVASIDAGSAAGGK